MLDSPNDLQCLAQVAQDALARGDLAAAEQQFLTILGKC